MAFKVSPFNKQANGSPFQIKSPLNVSYDAAYEAQSDEKKASQSKGEFKKAAEKYNMDNYGTKHLVKVLMMISSLKRRQKN